MTTSSTPVPSAAAIDSAAARTSSRRPLVTSLPSRWWISRNPSVSRATRSGSPESLPHLSYLAGAAHEVREHEQPDTGPPVVRRHVRQILHHQAEFARAVTGARAPPAQVVQVEQRVRLAPLLEQVGDLLGDRTLARPVYPCEEDTLGPALIHLARLRPAR